MFQFNGKFRAVNDDNTPLVGGLLYTYVSTTTTPKATYVDAGLVTPNTNPVVLDARGEANVWLGTGPYTMTLKRSDGTTVWSQDGVEDPSDAATSVNTTLRSDLASQSDGTKGAGLSGFSHANTYAAGTVGLALQGYINVKNAPYNAKGDGATDDTAAFSAALATGKDIYVPDGTYLITSSLTMSTTQQRLVGAGRLAVLQFTMTVANPALIFSGSSGRQWVSGLTLNASNCPKLFDIKSPQVQIFFNWITNTTSSGICIYGENENVGSGIYEFGTLIGYNFIHGSFTTGSRGIRLGLNSQTTQIFGNVIDNFETAIAVENATDSLVIEGNVLETLMSTGYGVDMRGTSGSPTYHNVSIRKNHFEDVYVGIAWGTNGASGSTYTSNVYENNYFLGHLGGTNYFLSALATVGAGSANNRVEYNDVSGNLTSFFNLADQNGAQSLVSTKGNTLAAGTFATGTYANYAYQIREHNGYFGAVTTSGAFTSQSVTRQECGTVTWRMFFKWDPHEYLESIQFKYLPTGATPSVTLNLHQCTVDTDTVAFTTGSITASGIVTLNVNTIALPGYHYYLEFVCALGGGTTAYIYPAQAYLRQ
jgi:hypothetical protein